METIPKKLSQNTKDAFLLEEYKFTIERIKNHEEKEYQLLVLSVTGFAAIFGFSSQILMPVIPIALLSILIICARGYSQQAKSRNFNSAFIIEKFEKGLSYLCHDTAYASMLDHQISNTHGTNLMIRMGKAVKSIAGFATDPFVILTVISLGSNLVFSYTFLISSWKVGDYYLCLGYLTIIFLGHILVLQDVFSRRKRTLHYYITWWSKYFTKNS